ncbi:MAG: hypothetical protein ABJG41_10865 [Cyclobacteriaceae bacterium]
MAQLLNESYNDAKYRRGISKLARIVDSLFINRCKTMVFPGAKVVEKWGIESFANIIYTSTLELPIEGYEAETSVPGQMKGRQ